MQKQNRMQDPEFEKQVRQKMDELKFSPSDAVWSNVEKEIKKDRRKRPLLWLFLFLIIALSGGYYLFSYQKTSNTKNHSNKQSDSISLNTEKEKTQKENTTEIHPKKDNKNAEQPVSSPIVSNNEELRSGNKNKSVTEKQKQDQNTVIVKQKTGSSGSSNLKQKNNSQIQEKPNNNISDETITLAVPANPAQETNAPVADKNSYLKDSVKTQEKGLTTNQTATKADSVSKNSVSNSVAAEKKSNEKSKKEKSWKIGFTGNAGASTVFENLFTHASYANYASYSSPGTLSSSGSNYKTATNIKPGFSFSAGASVEKRINKKFTLSGGLQYHYYSIKVEAGNKVDSTVIVTNPASNIYYLLAASAYSPYSNSPYYRSVDTILTGTHTNHYHFFEIPLSVLFQFNKSKKTPLFWELGVSLAELISSDELHFNSTNGTYSKDKSFFNKTQFNLNTSFLAGFHRNNLYFKLGPQFQYGLTDLLSTKADGNEHLFFGGVKFVLIPDRK